MIYLKERIGKLIKDVEVMINSQSVIIESFKIKKTYEKFSNLKDLDTSNWDDFSTSAKWGGNREYYWFDTFVSIPDLFDGKCVSFELSTGKEGEWDATNPQFTIFVNGEIIQGLDINHRSIVLTENAVAKNSYRITLSAYTGDENYYLDLKASLRVIDRQTEKYFYDISVPYNVALLLDSQSDTYIDIIRSLNESLNLLDMRYVYSVEYYRSLASAQENINTCFYERLRKDISPVVCCIGQTHIDVAWLWTLAVTEDKAVRSFATVLKLMDEYPEYKFISSQPQLYKYVQKNAPDVFEKIRERVQEGRWEAEGAMFVESDCNIASGEALIRQILVGTGFFRREFGVTNKILWLPDAFGFSAALPQIMKRSGIKYFMTSKLSWNEFSRMPYDTFDWIGLDGSRVLAYFMPTHEYRKTDGPDNSDPDRFAIYNGYLNPSQVMGNRQHYQQKHLSKETLLSFGYGDGGGGPTRDMLENYRRLEKGIPGIPRTSMTTALEFFKNLEKQVKNDKYLPEWTGELYLEYHRGTYTSMARNKKYNRLSEFAWQNAEWISSLNTLINGADYPDEKINDGWEVVLRNQFHDILPGSSIKEVYDDSKVEYESTLAASRSIIDNALIEISAGSDLNNNNEQSLTVFNPNGFADKGSVIFKMPDKNIHPVLKSGEMTVDCQKLGDGTWLAFVPEIPSKGYRKFCLTESDVYPEIDPDDIQESGMSVSADHMENDFFDIRLNPKGQFISIFDKKAGREVIPEGRCSNVLIAYQDNPHNYDAWNIECYYKEKGWEIDDVENIIITESGPVRGCLKIRRRYQQSVINQSVYIWRDLPRIDIRNEIDWNENQTLVKGLFPADLHCEEATFDIQYGNVQRSTHRNTSWDLGKFEVCMHKWVDLSEDGYGFSVLNDGKYGCDINSETIGISMLKSPIYPNPDADKEHHDFTIALLPHNGNWRDGGTVRQANILNNPLMAVISTAEKKVRPISTLQDTFSFIGTDKENVIVEVVKKAQDSSSWIIRIYECYNRRTKVRLTFAKKIQYIAECDLLENDFEEMCVVSKGDQSDLAADIIIMPYEIRTFKVRFF
ncbi:MAG: alpha-mannosidase [Saccharofermentanales bacterium]